MPELHKLTPPLGVLQDKGYRVALVTDGRMSGASGKVPAAIHVSPEALAGGPLGWVRDGDVVRLDAEHASLEALVPAEEWAARGAGTESSARVAAAPHVGGFGSGRELFAAFRAHVGSAETGASPLI
jgi:phosphogluconate dehydratase